MRIVVLGGGVIGVTTAYYLARSGHEVTVLERQPGPALEASFANAGQISPGYSSPWAAPGVPLKALKWMFQRHAPLAIRPDGSVFQWRWLLQMLGNCNAARYAVNKERMLRLARYSRECLEALRDETGIDYEQRASGTLQVFRSDAQLQAMARDVEVLKSCGVDFEVLDSEGCVRAEPGLAPVAHKLAGGLRLPGDETGDCHRFTAGLTEIARALGVRFEFGVRIEGFERAQRQAGAVRTDRGVFEADRYVLALGSYSRSFAADLRLDLPVYPVKGYSLTLPVRDAARAPVSTVMDETYKVAITRFDDRIRVGGMAELAGFDLRLDPRRRATLEMVVQDLFPGAGEMQSASFWTGLRPMTPDGTPLVGRSGVSNLWLNTGHGTLGWTMAAGSGRLLADLISGRRPAIRADDLSLDRYARRRSSAIGALPIGAR